MDTCFVEGCDLVDERNRARDQAERIAVVDIGRAKTEKTPLFLVVRKGQFRKEQAIPI